jgi:predicted permease
MSELVFFVVLMILAGFGLRQSGLIRSEAAKDLNHVVFYLTLPPLIFLALHGATLSWSLLAMPAIAWVITLFGLSIAWAFQKILKLPPAKAGALALALSFGNTTFFGYPLIHGLYGARQLTLAIFYDLLGSTLAVNTLGIGVAAWAEGASVKIGAIAKRLLFFPLIWALVLGLALHGVAIPSLLEDILRHFAELTSPLIMLSIGLSLELRNWRKDLNLLGLAAIGKLLLLPLLALGITRLFALPLAFQQAAVMQAAMPTMFYSLTLALLFGLELDLTVNAIMLTTLLSFVTLPFWHWVLALP